VEAYTGELDAEPVDEFGRGSDGWVAGGDCGQVSSGSYETTAGQVGRDAWAAGRHDGRAAGQRRWVGCSVVAAGGKLGGGGGQVWESVGAHDRVAVWLAAAKTKSLHAREVANLLRPKFDPSKLL
jgi:hypothetical protein